MSLPASDKEAVLARIREALKVPAPHRPSAPAPHAAEELRQWLPAVGPSYDEMTAAFAAQAAGLKAEFHRFPDLAAAQVAFRVLAAKEGWDRIAAHDAPPVQALLRECEVPRFDVREGYDKAELEKCPVGVTGCDALVAQTGSVLVTSASAGGRALSILPPHHLVIASRGHLVSDLPAAFARLAEAYGAKPPSLISFITGPSRTGDIERILVLGAHGPKRLTIYLVD